MARDMPASSEVDVRRITSKLEGARDRPKGANANRGAPGNMEEVYIGRERDRAKAERICDRLKEA